MKGRLSVPRSLTQTFQALCNSIKALLFPSEQGLSLRGSAKDQKPPKLISRNFLSQTLSGRKNMDKTKREGEREKGHSAFLDLMLISGKTKNYHPS